MLKPCKKDALKNRRLIALVAAIHGFFVYPIFMAILNKKYGVSDELCKSMLVYMEALTVIPLGGYFHAAYRQRDLNPSSYYEGQDRGENDV